MFEKIKPDNCMKIGIKNKSSRNVVDKEYQYQNIHHYSRILADTTFYIPNEEDIHMIRYCYIQYILLLPYTILQ